LNKQKKLISCLFDKALNNLRLRQIYDLRTSSSDGIQRMLNAIMLGMQISIHWHPNSNENVLLICGKLVELICDNDENEVEHIPFDPSVGNWGCIVPAGAWHTVEVLEPSIIYEAKEGLLCVIG
jgi:cupin fold WbuC family metalloprotein